MGEKREPKKVTFHCSAGMNDELDRLAEKIGITKSKLINNLLEIELGEIGLLEKLGLVDFSLMLRHMKDYLVMWREKMNKSKAEELVK